ncbi:MAG: M15 family metallopeptidase [Spirochaetales bacterium]
MIELRFKKERKLLILLGTLLVSACSSKGSSQPIHPSFSFTLETLTPLVQTAGEDTLLKVKQNPNRFLDLLALVLTGDRELIRLVDKKNPLPQDYEPKDLVSLERYNIRTSRPGLVLRQEAALALSEMSKAAKAEGIELVASSTYRSFEYQKIVNERVVRQIGQEAADRESAKPGHSQHQLGTAVDFGSISDAFTGTPMEVWLRRRAWEFGFSLSYPEGKETETGYRHESWHYRYIGKEAIQLEKEFFHNSQQKMLEFFHNNWESLLGGLKSFSLKK